MKIVFHLNMNNTKRNNFKCFHVKNKYKKIYTKKKHKQQCLPNKYCTCIKLIYLHKMY